MKKYILVILALLLASCESNSQDVEINKDQDLNNAISVLEKKGFDTQNYQILELPYGKEEKLEKMISVEGDGLFLIKDLLNATREKQYHTNNLLKSSVAGNLKIALKTSGAYSISQKWQVAFKEAIKNWNSIKKSFDAHTTFTRLKEVDISDDYDILVYESFLGRNLTIARAGFPMNGGTAFNGIYINSGFTETLTDKERIFTATHEIGHSLGLRHTNWFDRNSDGFSNMSDPGDYEGESSYGANYIFSTPTGLDPNSVMNAIVAPWNKFSRYDRAAIRYLYPKIIFSSEKQLIEYEYYIERGTPIIKFKLPDILSEPEPLPWMEWLNYKWFYKENHLSDSKWIRIKKRVGREGYLELPKNFSGKIQIAVVVKGKKAYSSKEIVVIR